MVISSTSTDAVIIHAVSPLLGVGVAGACANAAAAVRQSSDAVIANVAIRRGFPTVMRYASKSLRRIELVAGEHQIALSSVSPVRMRTVWSIDETKILPSPICPV